MMSPLKGRLTISSPCWTAHSSKKPTDAPPPSCTPAFLNIARRKLMHHGEPTVTPAALFHWSIRRPRFEPGGLSFVPRYLTALSSARRRADFGIVCLLVRDRSGTPMPRLPTHWLNKPVAGRVPAHPFQVAAEVGGYPHPMLRLPRWSNPLSGGSLGAVLLHGRREKLRLTFGGAVAARDPHPAA